MRRSLTGLQYLELGQHWCKAPRGDDRQDWHHILLRFHVGNILGKLPMRDCLPFWQREDDAEATEEMSGEEMHEYLEQVNRERLEASKNGS